MSSKRNDSWHKKVSGTSPERRCWKKEDIVREYKAIHDANFQSSWLREDVDGIEGRKEG